MLNILRLVMTRELRLAFRQRSITAQHLLFFVLVAALFPLGTQVDDQTLQDVAPAVIWTALLLSSLLSLQRLFEPDFEDGTLAQYLISPAPLSLIVLAKVGVHWLSSGLICVMIAPVLLLLLGMPGSVLVPGLGALLLGTPLLSLIGAIGSGLTLALPRAGMLLSLLIFPLFVPILVFGGGIMHAAAAGMPVAGPMYLLGALLAGGTVLAPMAIAAALRISQE